MFIPRMPVPVSPIRPVVGRPPISAMPQRPAAPVIGPRVPLQGLPEYHKGGKVKKTGPAMLKRGERVLTAKQAKSVRMKAAKMCK